MSRVLKLAIELINELYIELEAKNGIESLYPISSKPQQPAQATAPTPTNHADLVAELEKCKALLKKYNEFMPEAPEVVNKKEDHKDEIKEVIIKEEKEKKDKEIVQISLDLRTADSVPAQQSSSTPTSNTVHEPTTEVKKMVKKTVKKPEVKTEVKEINVQTKKSDKNKKK